MYDDYLTIATMEALGIDENEYMRLMNQASPYKSGMYFEVAEKDVFFDWCEENGLICSGNEVLLKVYGLKNSAIRAGFYEYGPTEKTVIFSFD